MCAIEFDGHEVKRGTWRWAKQETTRQHLSKCPSLSISPPDRGTSCVVVGCGPLACAQQQHSAVCVAVCSRGPRCDVGATHASILMKLHGSGRSTVAHEHSETSSGIIRVRTHKNHTGTSTRTHTMTHVHVHTSSAYLLTLSLLQGSPCVADVALAVEVSGQIHRHARVFSCLLQLHTFASGLLRFGHQPIWQLKWSVPPKMKDGINQLTVRHRASAGVGLVM